MTALARRLEQLERLVEERDLRAQVDRAAQEVGVSPDEFWERTLAIDRRLGELQAGGLSEEQAIRRYAEEEGMDPDWIMARTEEIVREHARTARRRQ